MQALHARLGYDPATVRCRNTEPGVIWELDLLSATIAQRRNLMATSMTGSTENRETHDLIGSDKVEGTNVYRSNGEKVGEIERVMLDKRGGKVAYAVMSFGGFLGLGHDHYPVPWARLTYSERLGGYEVNISDEELKGAPKYGDTEWTWDRDQGRKVYDYYRVPPYWS
jgi:hypothetical protein